MAIADVESISKISGKFKGDSNSKAVFSVATAVVETILVVMARVTTAVMSQYADTERIKIVAPLSIEIVLY